MNYICRMDLMYFDQEVELLSNLENYPSPNKISFIGPVSGAQKIRSKFSEYSSCNTPHNLVDLGNLTPMGSDFLNQVIHELASSGGPVVTCISKPTSNQKCKDFLDQGLDPVVITNRPAPFMSNHRCLGIQSHFFHDGFTLDPNKHLRLGDLRSDIKGAEVALRTADYIWIDISVLRYSDNIGHQDSSTAGLFIEELCMIAKYAGASTNLKAIVLSGFDENMDLHNLMSANISLLLFYILEGLGIAKSEKDHQIDLFRYTVIPDDLDSSLTFVEDKTNGRWWVELYSTDAGDDVQIACSEQDYFDACNNQLSDRITNLLASI